MTITGDLGSLRDRLYESYASQHSGTGSVSATRVIYRRDIRPLLPPPSAGPVLDIGCGSEHGHIVTQNLTVAAEKPREPGSGCPAARVISGTQAAASVRDSTRSTAAGR